MLFGVGCSGGSAPSVCYRPDDWRDKVVVEDGVATVVLTEDCELDLTVTEATLNGAGFSAELPAVGDVIPAGSWSIDVLWDDGWEEEGVVEDGSTFSATLTIEADGLDEQPAKELTYTVGE
ncbi:MAG: hypothetical protein VX519_01975 [Myxococcota bacterium]|nr:hypothetical protein [Myxococcota bacterium]